MRRGPIRALHTALVDCDAERLDDKHVKREPSG
jgi:hypothetical protein